MIYEEISHEIDGVKTTINIKLTDEDIVLFIPLDKANSDYQAYLAWKAEQPTPKAGK